MLPSASVAQGVGLMAKLFRIVHAVRRLARHASDKRRFKGWRAERQARRGR